MTNNTLTTHKIPYAGSLHNRCPYLPEASTTFIPVKPGTEQYAPTYPVAHNPLRYKRQEDLATNISHSYKTATSIAYTQSWDEYHRRLFSYYLYDHFGRPVETGQAKITHIRTGDQDKTLRMTNADIREHVHSLSNRLNVMVAIYNDADPFPACSSLPPDHQNDKIATIYYYPCIHAATPRSTDGQYYPSGSWYAAEYHYNPNHSITTTGYQCIAQAQDPSIDKENIAENQQLIIETPSLPAATEPEICVVPPAPHHYNCPLKNLDFNTLQHLHNQVFNVLYCHQSVPRSSSFAAGTTSPGKQECYRQPHYSLNPSNHHYYHQSYSPLLTHTHHCRGDTIVPNPLCHYGFGPRSLSSFRGMVA